MIINSKVCDSVCLLRVINSYKVLVRLYCAPLKIHNTYGSSPTLLLLVVVYSHVYKKRFNVTLTHKIEHIKKMSSPTL